MAPFINVHSNQWQLSLWVFGSRYTDFWSCPKEGLCFGWGSCLTHSHYTYVGLLVLGCCHSSRIRMCTCLGKGAEMPWMLRDLILPGTECLGPDPTKHLSMWFSLWATHILKHMLMCFLGSGPIQSAPGRIESLAIWSFSWRLSSDRHNLKQSSEMCMWGRKPQLSFNSQSCFCAMATLHLWSV